MIFICLSIIFFIFGIGLGIRYGNFAIKRGIVATATAFLPFLLLNFLSLNHPLIDDLRYYFFALAWGAASYWAYQE